jgi:hypothetical protein
MEDPNNIYSRSTFQTEPEKPLPKINIQNLITIFTPDDIIALTSSSDMHYGVTEFMTRYFTELGLQDKIDTNEINIIADFHYYNLCFAKDQLLLPNNKTALLLNIMARLIKFRDLGASNMMIKTMNQEMQRSKEEEYKLLLEQKFDELRDALLACSVDNPPFSIRIFTTDEVKKLLDYTMNTYFLHFRLYNAVMSNKQFSEQKNIEVYIDEPLPIPPLSEGLMDNPEREEIESEEEVDAGEQQKEENKEEEVKVEAKPEAKKTEVTTKRNKLVDDLIDTKFQQLKEHLEGRMGEHDKTFGKTIDDLKVTKK